MQINKLLTTINFNNTNRANSAIKFIVIHYVGGVSTAKNNVDYFKSVYRGASAHLFVDEKEIWQSVEFNDTAWHCGISSGVYKHPTCRNSNSIGIEICCKKDKNGKWYFEEKTVANTVELVKSLMKTYNIPISNVVRHYDVTGKLCPEPYVNNVAWNTFKSKLTLPDSTITTPSTPAVVVNTSVEKCNVLTDIPGYSTAADANNRMNKKTTVKKGTMYVYSKYSNGCINVTSDSKGKTPGSWINPKDNVVTTVDPNKYEVVATNGIPGYSTASDAMSKKNKKTTVKKGMYYVYIKNANGSINITTDVTRRTPGSWINPNENK